MYHVLAEAMAEAIACGDLPANSHLGNELRISEGLAVSRPTLRRALGILADRGMIVRRRGSGSIVLGTPIRRNLALTSLYEDLLASGGTPSTRVLNLEAREPDEEIQAAFQIPKDSFVTFIRRLRFNNDVPLAIMDNYLPLPPSALQITELENGSLYHILDDLGLSVKVSSQNISARLATKLESAQLELDLPAPVFVIERRSLGLGGEVVELAHHVFNAQLYSFGMNLVRDR